MSHPAPNPNISKPAGRWPGREPVARALVIGGLIWALTPWASVQVALAAGIALALLGLVAWAKAAKSLSRVLIQVSIVLLGFWIDLDKVVAAGAHGAAFSAGVIVLTFALGALLGRILRTEPKLTALLSSGTAICGGSAIAATGATIRASDTQMSVALGLVFLLNAIAVYVFPPLGHALNLSQAQFGAWAAVAIHDVANVVGAAKAYGDAALTEATVIKLTRVLWLVPICLVLGWWFGSAAPSDARVRWREAHWHERLTRVRTILPWFVAGFLGASLLRTLLDRLAPTLGAGVLADDLRSVSKTLLTCALFLVGCGLSRKAVLSVGIRPLLHGTLLWVVVSVVALLVIRATVP